MGILDVKSISKHITYQEVIYSYTAKKYNIPNDPNEDQLKRIIELAENVFEPLRENFKVPIYISSFFRSKELNKKTNGATGSQHLAERGAAMDIDADMYGKITNTDIFNYIKDNLEFDQLIAEHKGDSGPAWVHVSYNKGKNRKQTLIATKDAISGKQIYLPYSLSLFTEIYGKQD